MTKQREKIKEEKEDSPPQGEQDEMMEDETETETEEEQHQSARKKSISKEIVLPTPCRNRKTYWFGTGDKSEDSDILPLSKVIKIAPVSYATIDLTSSSSAATYIVS